MVQLREGGREEGGREGGREGRGEGGEGKGEGGRGPGVGGWEGGKHDHSHFFLHGNYSSQEGTTDPLAARIESLLTVV